MGSQDIFCHHSYQRASWKTYLCSSGGSGKTYIQTSTESSRTIIIVLDTIHLAINVGVSLIDGVHVELLEDPPGKEKPNAVGCGIVGQTNLHSIPIQGD